MAVDNYFAERRAQFQKSTLQKLTRGGAFRNLVPFSPLDLSDGRIPTVRTLTHELPTAYPTSLTEVTVSDNSGNALCNPTATTIKRGEIQRTFKLYGTAFKTDVLCLSDLKRAEQAADAVAAFERGLGEYVKVWWDDWHRIQNIAMVDNKVATKTLGVLTEVTSQNADHSGLTSLPNDDISWDHLVQLYWTLVQNGIADEFAVGRDSKGRLVLPLHAGAGVISRLWKSDSNAKEQVKYFDSAKNLQALGYDGAINGFVPMLDVFPIRYGKTGAIASVADLTATNMLYPTMNTNATPLGRKYVPNTTYKTVARGGLAEYEVVSILGPKVYEAKFEAIDPQNFSGAEFQGPSSYVGEFSWINNRTFGGENDLGNQGYYRADIRAAARPLFPELGVSILTKAKDATA